jgi:hypothetical protein
LRTILVNFVGNIVVTATLKNNKAHFARRTLLYKLSAFTADVDKFLVSFWGSAPRGG